MLCSFSDQIYLSWLISTLPNLPYTRLLESNIGSLCSKEMKAKQKGNNSSRESKLKSGDFTTLSGFYQTDKAFCLVSDIDLFTVRLILKVLLNKSNEYEAGRCVLIFQKYSLKIFLQQIHSMYILYFLERNVLPLSQENLQ